MKKMSLKNLKQKVKKGELEIVQGFLFDPNPEYKHYIVRNTATKKNYYVAVTK